MKLLKNHHLWVGLALGYLLAVIVPPSKWMGKGKRGGS